MTFESEIKRLERMRDDHLQEINKYRTELLKNLNPTFEKGFANLKETFNHFKNALASLVR